MPARHAVITGGGSGIGAATALLLAQAGVKVTLLGRDLSKLEAAARRMTGAAAFACDVAQADKVNNAFAAARERNGPISILVNNAGQAPSAPFERTDLDMWNNVLAVNLTSAFLCSKAALTEMKAQKWGRIVNVASTAALKGYAYVSAYCTAKHGLLGFTRALAQETAPAGVTVNAVCPGFTDTDLTRKAIAGIARKTGLDAAAAEERLAEHNPQNRLLTAEESAAAIAWLCSDAASGVNGAALSVSGGEI